MMRSAFALAAAALALGCAAKDVVVAELGDAGAEGAPPPPGAPCATNDDCDPDELCAKSACGTAVGGCQRRPVLCGDDGPPSCGCDGVTYWNDCLRRRSGVAASTPGECITGATCSSPDAHECPVPGASCARLVPPGAPCPPDVRGACWVLPDQCPKPGSGPPMPSYRACGPGGACDTACDAIRSGEPHEAERACM